MKELDRNKDVIAVRGLNPNDPEYVDGERLVLVTYNDNTQAVVDADAIDHAGESAANTPYTPPPPDGRSPGGRRLEG